jgi:hypothetical protein
MTTFKYVPRNKIDIPKEWTGDQAKAVWEFLVEEIGSAIWNVHEKSILEAMEREETMLERAARGELTDDDDYPF